MRTRTTYQVALKKDDETIPLNYVCILVQAGKYWWTRLFDQDGKSGPWERQDAETIKRWLS